MASVQLQDLCKTYRGQRGEAIEAVRHLTLDLADQELLVLVGPSGCGKTSTLRMIAGLEEVTAGSIMIGGRRINALPPKDRDVAMVFQNYALFPHLTVLQNLVLGLKRSGLPQSEQQQRIRFVADLLGLTQLLERRPEALSGGQRQRVALGRAMVRQPGLFLLDEPLSNLDTTMRARMRLELLQLHRRLAATMLYVTHDQAEAMALGDRIVVLHEGRVQQVASPMTLYDEPANLFVAGFIGSPPMNFFPGVLTEEAGQVCFVEQPGGADAPGPLFRIILPPSVAAPLRQMARPGVVLGVRPEHILPMPPGSRSVLPGVFQATIAGVEILGAETHLHLSTGSTSFIARTTVRTGWRIHETISVGLDFKQARFFDPVTEGLLA